MKQYTVIGFYDDTGLKYLRHHRAESPLKAAEAAARVDGGLIIAAVIAGKREDLMTTGDYIDSGEELLDMEMA